MFPLLSAPSGSSSTSISGEMQPSETNQVPFRDDFLSDNMGDPNDAFGEEFPEALTDPLTDPLPEHPDDAFRDGQEDWSVSRQDSGFSYQSTLPASSVSYQRGVDDDELQEKIALRLGTIVNRLGGLVAFVDTNSQVLTRLLSRVSTLSGNVSSIQTSITQMNSGN